MTAAPETDIEPLENVKDTDWDALNGFPQRAYGATRGRGAGCRVSVNAFAEAAAEAPLELDERLNR